MLIQEEKKENKTEYKIAFRPNFILALVGIISFLYWRNNPESDLAFTVFILAFFIVILSRVRMESNIFSAWIKGKKISTSGKPLADKQVEIEN